jgi:hypothetical protein
VAGFLREHVADSSEALLLLLMLLLLRLRVEFAELMTKCTQRFASTSVIREAEA